MARRQRERVAHARLAKKASAATKRASARSRARVAKAASISRAVLALKTAISTPIARAAFRSDFVRGLGVSHDWRIDQHGKASRLGHQLTQQSEPLRIGLDSEKIDARDVAARPVEAGDEPEL